MVAMPRAAQVSAAADDPSLARRAATNTAAGIGHGAATPAPHPTRIPVETENGTPTPNGRPGRSSLMATAEVYPTIKANPIADLLSARLVS
jgi:hypothetical protein